MELTASKAFCYGSSAKLAKKGSRASTVRMPVVVRAQAGEQTAEVVRCQAFRIATMIAGCLPMLQRLLGCPFARILRCCSIMFGQRFSCRWRSQIILPIAAAGPMGHLSVWVQQLLLHLFAMSQLVNLRCICSHVCCCRAVVLPWVCWPVLPPWLPVLLPLRQHMVMPPTCSARSPTSQVRQQHINENCSRRWLICA